MIATATFTYGEGLDCTVNFDVSSLGINYLEFLLYSYEPYLIDGRTPYRSIHCPLCRLPTSFQGLKKDERIEDASREEIGMILKLIASHPPFDIILLFDLIIRQFETAVEREFVQKSEWKNFVRRSEDFRLKEYYTQIEKYYENKEVKHGNYRKTLFETMCDKVFDF